ncbi:MAG TPA: hypothetical protein VGB82_20850 [Alphaproteobacteria bacterium]
MIRPATAITTAAKPRRSRARATATGLPFNAVDGLATAAERVQAAAPPARVAKGPAPVFSGVDLPQDRGVVEQFCADLAAAPEIVGELVALYVEQYPRLALRFVALAVKVRLDAAMQIEAAARWREVCGAVLVAELMRAALDFALPPVDPEPLPAAVVLDLDGEYMVDLDRDE